MAKPTKYADEICIGVTVFSMIGMLLGVILEIPLIIVALLLPTVAYEIYRTEGKSTKFASIGLGIVFVLTLVMLIFNVSYDLTQYLNVNEKYIQGYEVPIGDIKLLGPSLMAVLSIILFKNTRGKYTKWLSVVIIVTSFAIVWALDKTIFERFIKIAIEEGSKLLN